MNECSGCGVYAYTTPNVIEGRCVELCEPCREDA